jgi:hypothetical protein
MDQRKLDDLITQVENYLECWKQFNQSVVLARSKKFSQDDENQFLELKSVLTQELELILASFAECSSPTKEEVIALVSASPPSAISANKTIRPCASFENEWHKSISVGSLSSVSSRSNNAGRPQKFPLVQYLRPQKIGPGLGP